MPDEPLLIGWEDIHSLFCDVQGNPVMALSTLQQKYGAELLEKGLVFRMKTGKGKRIRVCAWPSEIRHWWTRKQQKSWLQKNPAQE